MRSLFQNNYESDNDERLDRKFSYNYQVIKRIYPKASELPEEEVRGIIRQYYQAPKGQEEQAIKDYIRQKEPEWQQLYGLDYKDKEEVEDANSFWQPMQNNDVWGGYDNRQNTSSSTIQPMTEQERQNTPKSNNINDENFPNLQRAMQNEGYLTDRNIAKVARRSNFTPGLAPMRIVNDASDIYNKKFNDKYKHAYINCINAQQGTKNTLWADYLSRLKEIYDIYSKNNTREESEKDMDANLTGRFLGLRYPDGDCDELVQRYYKKQP